MIVGYSRNTHHLPTSPEKVIFPALIIIGSMVVPNQSIKSKPSALKESLSENAVYNECEKKNLEEVGRVTRSLEKWLGECCIQRMLKEEP